MTSDLYGPPVGAKRNGTEPVAVVFSFLINTGGLLHTPGPDLTMCGMGGSVAHIGKHRPAQAVPGARSCNEQQPLLWPDFNKQ